MRGYVFVSYGPKPEGPITGLKAARQQTIQFELLAEQLSIVPPVVGDFSRQPVGRVSLPVLFGLLADTAAPKVVMDDLRRIFRMCPAPLRSDLLEDLQDYGSRLFELRKEKTLNRFSEEEIVELLFRPHGTRFVVKGLRLYLEATRGRAGSGIGDTGIATRARTEAADRAAAPLLDVRDDLLMQHGEVSNGMIADEANRRRLRTSRGGRWGRLAVARALLRASRMDDAEG